MPAATAASRDHRAEALVLRRVNFGEADRILDLLTPSGLISVLAKSVRKEKSRLAGGVELFCLSDITYHESKNGGLATLTGAKMKNFYSNLLTDFDRMELASEILKSVGRTARHITSPDFFNLTRDSLEGLNNNLPVSLVKLYFGLNLIKISGEEPNLHYDTKGKKLVADEIYTWNPAEHALEPDPKGLIGPNDIKLLRLMLSSSLALVSHVRYDWDSLSKFCGIIE